MKIEEFHGATGATVVIGNNDHKARWVIRRGLSQQEFVKLLKGEIRKAESRQAQCPGTDNIEELLEYGKKSKTYKKGWYNLPDEDIKLYMDQK